MVKPKEYTLHTSMTVAGQPVVNYDYYDNGWLENVRQVVNSVEQRFNFVYDDGGRRERLKSFNGVSLVTETIYGFDNASRLLEMKHLDSLNIELEVLNYLYDPNSNRTTMNRPSVNLPLPNQVSNTSYNEANQMLSFNDKNISYDNNGNMESVTNSCGTTTYTWNAKNQLVNISGFNTDCSSLTASFKYDALGRRFEKTINGTTTQYVYDGVDIIQEKQSGVVTANYIRGLNIDEPLARSTQNGLRLYLTDALGSVIALTDENGIIKTQYSYDPFGNTTVSGEASDNPFQYTGRENDNTGLYYYRARYYSPELQRFISEDPIRIKGGINLYAYTGNNPINFVDPKGKYLQYVVIGGFVIYFGYQAYDAWKNEIESMHQTVKQKDDYYGYLNQNQFDEGAAYQKCKKYNESQKQTLRSIPNAIQSVPGTSATGPVPTSLGDLIMNFFQDLIIKWSLKENEAENEN